MSSRLHGLVSSILADMQSRLRLFNQLTDTSIQARRLGRKEYFEDPAITSPFFYLPYIRKFHPIDSCSKILEIGCDEGGNLEPFANTGCRVFGVNMAQIRIGQAQQFFSEEKLDGCFESDDFLECPAPSEGDKFDIAIPYNVIEHVPDKIVFLSHIRKFLKENDILFVAFPAWQISFGRHQQICRNKIWSKVSFFHLVPDPLCRFILKKLTGEEEATIKGLLYIKQCKCSIKKFEQAVKAEDLSIKSRQLWFINPHYLQKFGLWPRELC